MLTAQCIDLRLKPNYMRKVLLSLTCLTGFLMANAQQKEGTIVYERKINMHKTIPDEQMRAMMPEFRISKHMLLFSDSVSVYKAIPEDEAPDPFAGAGGGGPRMVMRFGNDGGDLYKNFGQSKSVLTSELGGKNFLIVDSIKPQPWKLSMETKQILGLTCHKATRKMPAPQMGMRVMTMGGPGGATTKDTTVQKPVAVKEMEIVAWFADNIISPVGPENYGQLPGVILELDIDNSKTVYTAKEIKATVEAKELKEPKKGKVVTQEEYRKLMMQMMQNQGGPGMFRRSDN
jgi:GLPGLI family protein